MGSAITDNRCSGRAQSIRAQPDSRAGLSPCGDGNERRRCRERAPMLGSGSNAYRLRVGDGGQRPGGDGGAWGRVYHEEPSPDLFPNFRRPVTDSCLQGPRMPRVARVVCSDMLTLSCVVKSSHRHPGTRNVRL
jgi:hypothetical protein